MDHGVRENEFRQQRIENMRRLEAMGYTPFGARYERTGRIAEVIEQFREEAFARITGRVMSKRVMGKSIFAHLQDGPDRFQVYVRRETVGDQAFEAFEILDLGDVIGAEGELFTTRTGERSLKASQWTLLSKALLPMPEKWHGLQEVELRYRYRYLDLIANPEVRRLFDARSAIIRMVRSFLGERGFCEVETPMIQSMAGGAAANPFKTHYQALNADMYLRIAPELYLKRLLVGGYDKVFELNRNFRNEGLDRSHNPEFTMLEVYEAFGDARSMMDLVRNMIVRIAQEVKGSLQVGSEEAPVDLSPPWRVATYRELILERAGEDWYSLQLKEARDRARGMGLDIPDAFSFVEMTHEIYEKLIEKTLQNPTFVTCLPVELVPLARRTPDDPSTVDVFELVIQGKEVAPGYTELNDPIEQRKRFEEQAGGDPSKIDQEFLFAMEHGMPPAGGMGVGVDRLAMILLGVDAIRDVILFPQLKGKG